MSNICENCGHDEAKCSPDETYRLAEELVKRRKYASPALLQHELKISYEKAAEILDILENDKIVGPADGARPREVY